MILKTMSKTSQLLIEKTRTDNAQDRKLDVKIQPLRKKRSLSQLLLEEARIDNARNWIEGAGKKPL